MCIFRNLAKKVTRTRRRDPVDRYELDLRLRFENAMAADEPRRNPETPTPTAVSSAPAPPIRPIVAFAHEEPDVDIARMTPAEERRLVDAYLRHRATVTAVARVATDRGSAAFLAPFAEASSRHGRDVLYDIAQRQRFERFLRGEDQAG